MSKLSEEQMTNLANIIECNGVVLLQCDEFNISLMNVGLFGRGGAHLMIDDCMNVNWLRGSCYQSKYLKPATDDMPIWMGGWQYQPYFYSAKTALEHLNDVSNKIELLRSYTS